MVEQEEIEEVGSAYAGELGRAGELDKSRRMGLTLST